MRFFRGQHSCAPARELTAQRHFWVSSDRKELFRSLAQLSSMGISVVAAIAIGVWFGLTLDGWCGTSPWFFYLFLCIGIAAGFKNIYLIARREAGRGDDAAA